MGKGSQITFEGYAVVSITLRKLFPVLGKALLELIQKKTQKFQVLQAVLCTGGVYYVLYIKLLISFCTDWGGGGEV